MSETMTADLDTKFMVDPYLNWVKAEGVLVHSGEALDLLALELRDWPRYGMKGAVCHVDGRCDFLTAFLFELNPQQESSPQRHIFEEVFYVLSGSGETEITLSNGHVQTISWGPKQLFAVPINARARHRAGNSPARFVSLNDFCYLMGLYRNEAFLFANPSPFEERQHAAMSAGLCADPTMFSLGRDDMTAIPLADMSVGVDVTGLAPRQASLARRQMQGRHLLGVEGSGYTLSFANDSSPIRKTDWRHGILTGLKGMQFHQHVNLEAEPARFISVELGSRSSPMFRSRRATFGDQNVYASGAAVIESGDERPDILPLLP